MGTDKTCSKEKLQEDDSKQTICHLGMDKCMRTWVKKDSDTLVVNSCGNDAECKELKEKCDDAKDGECAVGCCDSDLCNAGSSVSFSVFLMTVCSALGLALLK